MSTRFASVLIALVLSSAVSAALAQPAPPAAGVKITPAAPSLAPQKEVPSEVSPLTVQAARSPKAIEKQTHKFVETFAKTTAELDQIARWHDPVCVLVYGLNPEQDAQIKARIEEVSKAVDHPVGRKGCKPNIQIIFTDRPQAVMDDLAKRNEFLLGYYHRQEKNKLKTVTRPIQAWYATATEGGGANIAGLMFNPGGEIPGCCEIHPEVLDDPDNRPPAACGDSPHFTACLRENLKNVFVVADTKALQGRGVGLLSDYLVMVTLAEPSSLDGCNVLPSVIDLLSKTGCPDREAPEGLTPGDASYLTSLYNADLEANKQGEQSDIASRMAKMLTRASAAKSR